MPHPDVSHAGPQPNISGVTGSLESLVLATKLHIPRSHAELVPRPRLQAQLDRALHVPLTLIVAPAGFGKTTVVVQWLNTITLRVAWLSLDVQDNDPAIFMRYLVGALQTVAPQVGITLLALLHAPQPPPPETLITLLINDLVVQQEPLLLVLDDYHVLHATPIHELVRLLIERLPPHIHLVLTSREDPPLPLARLRARSRLIELRSTHLRFTVEEAEIFLREVMGLAITTEQITVLEARVEGWVAGLHLVALALQERRDVASFVSSFTGSHRFIVEYLIEEVLSALPHYLRTFVLHIAVLERFCAPLCDALVLSGASESHYSQVLIEQISRMNLFVIPLDDARRWYRFHHLFADVLRGRLKDGANPDTIVELHRRASHWYQHQELIHEAIYHAMEANAPEVAADIIEARGHSVIARGELTTVIGWIRALPESVFHERPRLLLTLAWALPNTGAIDDVLRYLAMAEAIIARKPDQLLQSECSAIRLAPMVLQEHNAEASALGVEILQYLPPNHMFRPITSVITGVALFRQGRFAEAVQLLSQAVVESRAAKALFYLIPSHDFLAAIARERGDFAEAERKYQQSLDKSKGSEGTVLPLAGMPLVGLGRLRWLQGQWEAAEQAYVEGLRLCVLLNAAAFYFMEGYIGLAEIRRTQGRYAEALELLSVLEDRVRVLGNPVFLDTITAHRVRVWLMQKEDAAVRWLNEHNLQRGSTLVFVREDEYVTLIRVLLTTGQLDTAFAWLDEVEALARAEGRMRSVVDLLVLRAVAHYTQQDRERANAVVLQALDLAAPMNYISAFVSEGTPVAALLREAHARNIYPGYCERLLAAFSHAEHVVIPEQPAKPRQSTTLLPEPLNERELEVLRLIAQGHSNQQIADRLVVAISTVKWHINNLYGKLGVGTRTQALARATQLGLL